MEKAVECDEGGPGMVASWDRLHRGDLYEGREAHVRTRGQHPGPIAPLQFQPGRQHAKAIDIHEGETVDAGAFKVLVKAAVAQNATVKKR
jgi:hypothetical protein